MRMLASVPETVYSPEYNHGPEPGSVLDYWAMLGSHRLLFSAFTIAGLLVALGVSLAQAPVYRAHTSIEIQDANNELLNMKLVSPVAQSAPVDALTDVQTQIKILQSNTLIERALEQLHISSLADLNPHPNDTAGWRHILKPIAGAAESETLTEAAAKNLKVSVAGQTRIVEVAFDATEPDLAARFANALTSEFIDQNMQARWQMSHQTSEWLLGQLDDVRGKLHGSENALQAYARRQGLIYTGDKQNVSEEKLRQLQAELSKAQADRVEKQSRFEIAGTAAAGTLPEVLNDANLQALETSLADLRRKQAELGVTFTPDYSRTKTLRAETAALESAIDEKRAAIVSRIDNELREARRREQLLTTAYATQTVLVTGDSEKSIQYEMLKREVDTNRQIYEAMLQRVKESAIASAMKASNVRVIDPAKPPLHPYKPNVPIASAAGLLCGAMFGLVTIVIRARTDSSVHEPGDAGLLLGIPELGVIPAAARGRKSSSPVLTLFHPDNEFDNPGNQLTLSIGNSPAVADSFRTVLASIIFGEATERKRVLVITSASPGEGKTTAAANLAITLANMNRRVLLIDGDIRSPRIHDIFGLDNSMGITDLLRKTPADDSFDSLIRRTASENLYVLTSGPAIQAGADLLFSRAMPALIARCRERFDMVIIDAPPVLSMPDARVLARTADAAVLIARAGRTTRPAVQAAFRRLVDDHTPVLGIILNGWNVKSSPYKYYAPYRKPVAEACIDVRPADAH